MKNILSLGLLAIASNAFAVSAFYCSGQMALPGVNGKYPAVFSVRHLGNGNASFYLESQGRVIANGMGHTLEMYNGDYSNAFGNDGTSVYGTMRWDTPYEYPVEFRIGRVAYGPNAGQLQGVFYYNYSSWGWFNTCREG